MAVTTELTRPVPTELDVAVVGAGAAGLMAAIFAARPRGPGLRVAALEGAAKFGAKILISGGGRCNVTHEVVRADDFHGSSRAAIANVLKSFDVAATIDFFASLGVTLEVEPGGKLFPTSNRARTVLDALLRAASDGGVDLRTNSKVESVATDGSRFFIKTKESEISSSAVVIATGGRSVPKTGSDGSGYDLLKSLGHTVVDTTPALVPLLLPEGHWLRALSGVSADVELRLLGPSGKVLARRQGAMLLTHFGLSGPVILDMSRLWIAARTRDAGVTLTVSLFPGLNFEAVDAMILDEAGTSPRMLLTTWLSRALPARLAVALLGAVGSGEATALNQLSRRQRKALAHALVALPLPVTSDRGFDYAEVTAGGVPMAEVDPATMESRVRKGLFLSGEILDVDGWIGGYNFQWAWASGRLAGLTAARHARGAG
ncbi:MAG TPA: NAD(P)/FAD-dependent oxidoreductase [Thermoanaerobaculia bacterium]|nr:NAD(P)/FAD-dependent oxidoreductase [Thermoanaerobaculia bacterium]